MYIIIVGGGSVGYYLCKALIEEGHEVLVVEKSAAKCETFTDELGSICMRGDGCEVATLTEAGTSRADVFIAATDEDEDNLVACQVAKHKFSVPRTIARVNNPKNETIFKKLGIDCPISVTKRILEDIEEKIPSSTLIHLLTIGEERDELLEMRIPDGARAAGKKVKDLHLPKDSLLILLMRNGQKPQVPGENTVLQANDRIVALTSTDTEEALRKELAGS